MLRPASQAPIPNATQPDSSAAPASLLGYHAEVPLPHGALRPNRARRQTPSLPEPRPGRRVRSTRPPNNVPHPHSRPLRRQDHRSSPPHPNHAECTHSPHDATQAPPALTAPSAKAPPLVARSFSPGCPPSRAPSFVWGGRARPIPRMARGQFLLPAQRRPGPPATQRAQPLAILAFHPRPAARSGAAKTP